jgi:hypothetical protein
MSKAAFPFPAGTGHWLDRSTYIDGKKREWATEKGGARRFGLSRSVIHYARVSINHQRVPPPPIRRKGRGTTVFPRPEVCVYAVDWEGDAEFSLRAFAAKYHSSNKKHPKTTGKKGMSQDDIREEFGLSGGWCWYWSHKRSRLRDDGSPALRFRLFTSETPVKGMRRNRSHQYRRKDLLAILAGKETGHASVGRANPARHRTVAPSAVRKFLKKALADGPLTTSEVRAVVRQKGIPRARFLEAIKSLGIRSVHVGHGRNRVDFYWLPKQQVPLASRIDRSPALRRIVEFLRRVLADGRRHPRQEILALAKEEGFDEKRLYLAFPHIGIVREKGQGGDDGRTRTWRLRNPPHGHTGVTTCETEIMLVASGGANEKTIGRATRPMPGADSDTRTRNSPNPQDDRELQDINPCATRTSEIGPKARQTYYEATRDGVRDGMREFMHDHAADPIPPKGRPGRPRDNDHFIAYFTAERERHTKAEKTDKDIFLAYRSEYPGQKICTNKKDLEGYLNACRSALSEARKKV